MLKKVLTYFTDVRQEMSKVSWPTRAELIESTSIVMMVSGLLALMMFLIDTVFNKLVQFIL